MHFMRVLLFLLSSCLHISGTFSATANAEAHKVWTKHAAAHNMTMQEEQI